MRPRPSQVGQASVSSCGRLARVRLRVISTRPSSEILRMLLRILSCLSAVSKASMTRCWFAGSIMSMKSTMMMPPMLRRRS